MHIPSFKGSRGVSGGKSSSSFRWNACSSILMIDSKIGFSFNSKLIKHAYKQSPLFRKTYKFAKFNHLSSLTPDNCKLCISGMGTSSHDWGEEDLDSGISWLEKPLSWKGSQIESWGGRQSDVAEFAVLGAGYSTSESSWLPSPGEIDSWGTAGKP